MPELMSFKEMIEEYGVTFFSYQEAAGQWADNGDWVPGANLESLEILGILLPLSEDDLRYADNGTYSVKDRKVYTTSLLTKGQKIEYKGIRYTVQNFKDYSDYADINIYFARWAGNET